MYDITELLLLRLRPMRVLDISCVLPVWLLVGRTGEGERDTEVEIVETDEDDREDREFERLNG